MGLVLEAGRSGAIERQNGPRRNCGLLTSRGDMIRDADLATTFIRMTFIRMT
jgi:hypothetical protein